VFKIIKIKEVAAIMEAIFLHKEVQLLEIMILTVAALDYPLLNFSETKAVHLEMAV
jgi:hypothetical protein